MIEQDIKKFHESIGNELFAIKDRVRNLIGSVHWGKDGEYKEAILKNIIKRFLPSQCSVGTGFVINEKGEVTSQIDIIIYDNTRPVLFKEGDFVIVQSHTVKGIMEVKTKINSHSELKDIIIKAEENAKKITKLAVYPILFNGIFSYEWDISFNDSLKSSMQEYFFKSDCPVTKKVNNIALGFDYFIHLWEHSKQSAIKGYKIEGLSFSYLLGNLLQILDRQSWDGQSFLFPLKSKDSHEVFSSDNGQS